MAVPNTGLKIHVLPAAAQGECPALIVVVTVFNNTDSLAADLNIPVCMEDVYKRQEKQQDGGAFRLPLKCLRQTICCQYSPAAGLSMTAYGTQKSAEAVRCGLTT